MAKAAKITRFKKIIRVVKYKLLKPFCYAMLASFFIYLTISNAVSRKELRDLEKPHFVISRISNSFDNIEFMHLLLTIQEINLNKTIYKDLALFVNAGFPNYCPNELRRQLYIMNWEPQAFLIRVKKMFELLDIYERIIRIDETVNFLEEEILAKRLSKDLKMQVNVLKKERSEIFSNKISSQEYEFIKEFYGIVQRLRDFK